MGLVKFAVIASTTVIIFALSIRAGSLADSFGFGLFMFLFLESLFLVQAMRKIKTVHAAIETFAGKRQRNFDDSTKYLKEGWHVLPLQPLLFGAVQIKVEAVNFDPEFPAIRTPDMAELKFTAGVTFEPWPEFLINYENKGEADQVKKILEDVIGGAIRGLATVPDKKPETWKEAVSMQSDFMARVVDKILTRHDVPGIETPERDRDLENNLDYFQEVMGLVEQLEDGGANLPVEDLGICIRRINIKKIEPQGKLHEDAEKVAREQAQKEAELKELDHVKERIHALVDESKDEDGHPRLTYQEAARIIQSERGKVTHHVNENRWSMSPEVNNILSPVVGRVVDAIDKKANPDNSAVANGIENGLKAIANSIQNIGQKPREE